MTLVINIFRIFLGRLNCVWYSMITRNMLLGVFGVPVGIRMGSRIINS